MTTADNPCGVCICSKDKRVKNKINETSDMFFIGSSPNRAELFNKEALSGKARRLFQVVLEDSGINYKDISIGNALQCKPPRSKKINLTHLNNCRSKLVNDIKKVNPKIIVLMGKNAIRSFYQSNNSVTESRGPGKWNEEFNAFVVSTYSPNSIFYSPRSLIDFDRDIKTAVSLLNKKPSDLPELEQEYKLLDTPMKCLKMFEWFSRQDLISIDIETEGFKWYEDKIIAIGLSAFEGTSYIIPEKMIDYPVVMLNLQTLLENPSVKFVWQGGQFDCRFLRYQYDIKSKIDEDTLLKHYCVDERRGTHSLSELSKLYLGAKDYESEFKKYIPSGGNYGDAPKDKLYEYLAKDTDYVLKINKKLDEEISENYQWIYDNILIPATNMLIDVELRGIKLDEEKNEQLLYEYGQKVENLSNTINDLVVNHFGFNPSHYVEVTDAKSEPEEFNPNSPQQLSHVLYDLIGFDRYEGKRTTNRAALDHFFHEVQGVTKDIDRTREDLVEVIHEGGNKGEVVLKIPPERLENPVNKLLNTIIVWRRYSGIYTKFIKAMKDHANFDGRIHCLFKLYGTETGRLSSTDPNLQNIPRDSVIRGQFTAKEGYKIIEADYSQAELRTLAFLSQDESLIKLYNEGKDLHDETTKEMFGEDFTYEQRSITKSINFGIPYGRGYESIALQFGLKKSEAKDIIEKWKSQYSGANKWLEEQKSKVLSGETIETAFGRTRNFGYISRRRKHHVMREVVNFPIQSTASDFLLLSAIHLHEKFKNKEINLVNLVHDAILFEVKENKVKEYGKIIKDTMEWVPKHYQNVNIPFEADVEVGDRWGSTSKINFKKEVR